MLKTFNFSKLELKVDLKLKNPTPGKSLNAKSVSFILEIKLINLHILKTLSSRKVSRLGSIHTRQLNFLFSDWLFSKYAECIENVHCTPRTAPRLRLGLCEVLLVRDLAREHHID